MDTGMCPYCGVTLEIGLADYGQGRCGSCGNKILVKPENDGLNLKVSWNEILSREIGFTTGQIEELLAFIKEGLSRKSIDGELNRLVQRRTELKALLLPNSLK